MPRIYFYYAALTGFFGLFLLLMAWHTMLAPSSHLPVAVVLLTVVTPLLLPMRGLLNAHLKSCTWMSYISLAYLIHGVVESYANATDRPLAVLEVLLSLLLCFGSGCYVYTADKVSH